MPGRSTPPNRGRVANEIVTSMQSVSTFGHTAKLASDRAAGLNDFAPVSLGLPLEPVRAPFFATHAMVDEEETFRVVLALHRL